MIVTLIYPPLSRKCCALWFFRKPVNRFHSLSCMNASIWPYMFLSETFDTLNKTPTGLWFPFSRSSFFLKIELTSASFKPSGKHPFSNRNLMIFLNSDVYLV